MPVDFQNWIFFKRISLLNLYSNFPPFPHTQPGSKEQAGRSPKQGPLSPWMGPLSHTVNASTLKCGGTDLKVSAELRVSPVLGPLSSQGLKTPPLSSS